MRRTKEDAALTREQVLHAALLCFQEKGFAATTLDDVARRAGTTRGAVYWHFHNKVELFHTVVQEQYTRVGKKLMDLVGTSGTAWARLRRVLLAWCRYPAEDHDFRLMLELLMQQAGLYPELAAGIRERIQVDYSVQLFADLIQQAMAEGSVRPDLDPAVAARTALGMLYGVSSLWLLQRTAFSLVDEAEAVVDLFLRGISCPTL